VEDKKAEIFLIKQRLNLIPPGFAKERLLERLRKLEEELRNESKK